jgi:hypothetical protein
MTGKELWDFMSQIQNDMQPDTTPGYEWETLPVQVQYVWIKAGLGLIRGPNE